METENQNQVPEEAGMQQEQELAAAQQKNYLPLSIVCAAVILGGAWVYTTGLRPGDEGGSLEFAEDEGDAAGLEVAVLPASAKLPATWGDLGKRMVEAGVIDKAKFEELYASRGGLSAEDSKLLSGEGNGKLTITRENSGLLLNLLWALGLGNKNEILEKGPMSDASYGGAGNFASTGGWTVSKGDAMDHYSKYEFMKLTTEQQKKVENVSKGIYRPCCGNSTYFPDCNHGMAMLGLLELMASQGASEDEMYKAALKVNAYWFPDTYLAIAKYFENRGKSWSKVDPKEALGNGFSSSAGYRKVLQEVTPPARQGGGGCGV